ncbi:prepilin-type N-terminal cleavage/methylation domain-containing protein [Bacteroides thetaiotaomicron]|jgi:pilin like competence factor|nr:MULTISPECIES: prepilin-type N-terminal cleavage/methylation domain-containing protein [unclassified Pseudoflavonifractor]KAB4815623.1 prepilin-type N-terminal cleavage/methylation domain-containing protein [Bacteroides thetaiotaomicron]MTQ98055.1 prepilin-type N-terminal cleavage/methylation domain-containing protein [Pseudoflavonifractor sp. BIOML-A16]MTR07507.1 prepilin-type N-terminal cleavage/methylation domain-containing protein [Pseudoflavonifractor sp. BIOML-A15]MTR33335.1 prepilin-ty
MKTVLANKLRKNKKGFTLAELLVVVAIIAILVAIAIPVFSSATDKAQQAVEVANARSVYAEGMVNYISSNKTTFSKTYDGKTYAFTYKPATETEKESWEVAVTATDGVKVYKTPYTSFDGVTIDGD